jgi:polyferredoxin
VGDRRTRCAIAKPKEAFLDLVAGLAICINESVTNRQHRKLNKQQAQCHHGMTCVDIPKPNITKPNIPKPNIAKPECLSLRTSACPVDR